MSEPAIEWGSEVIIHCHCRHVFRSRTRQVVIKGRPQQVSEKPCPHCGRDDDMIGASSSDWGELYDEPPL